MDQGLENRNGLEYSTVKWFDLYAELKIGDWIWIYELKKVWRIKVQNRLQGLRFRMEYRDQVL